MKPIYSLFTCMLATMFLATSCRTQDDSVRFFKGHPKEIDFRTAGDSLLFANREVGLEIRRSASGFRLVRLYGIKTGQDFLAPDSGEKSPELLQISASTTKDGKLQVADVDISGVKETSSRVEDLGSASRLHLSWKGISLPGESGAMDADVAITLKAGDPLSRWQFRVRNPSKTWGIEKVYLPILNLSPIADSADNVFIYPRHRGRLVEDPFQQQLGFGDGVHNGGAYPGPFGMQFQALYNKRSGIGLFLGTQDPVPSIKTFEAPNYPTHITWRVAHFPANIGHPGEDYDLDYDCVVGPFTGDWWDACQIYRQWAVKQTWCRKGRLSTRTDIPKWYKEAPIYLTINPGGDDPNAGALDHEIAPSADEFMKFVRWAGMPLPGNWYGWKDYRTKLTAYDLPTNIWRFKGDWATHRPCTNVHDGNYPKIPALPSFGREGKRLLQAGGRVCPYITLQLYDQGPAENAPYVREARPSQSVDRDGKPVVHSSEGTWSMCSWRPWWMDRVKETCSLLLKREGAGGFYLDTMSGRSMACYGAGHGHSAAGGSSMTLGMHRLSEYVRDAVKALDPETITSGEDSSENMIDVIDGKLYQLNLVPVSTAPLYAAVYNDYIPRYGIRTHAWEESFFMQAASLFVEGAQVGRIPIGSVKREDLGVLSVDDPAQKSMLDYLGQMVAYYRQDLAKKYLCYGQVMHPLTFRQPDPVPILSYTIREKWAQTGTVELPALQSGVFLADDGDLGVFIVNAGKDEVMYSSDLDPARYRMPENGRWDVQLVTPAGEARTYRSGESGPVNLKGSLPGRSLTMFSLKVAR